jgi:nucleoside-diphosphate-sugar epimerase
MRALVTGSAGFFGSLLKDRLLADGWEVTGVDLLEDAKQPGYTPKTVDIRDPTALGKTLDDFRPDAIFHCAAVLAHDRQNRTNLWSSNVDGTACIAQAAIHSGVQALVFISSNCLWSTSWSRPVSESETPAPVEIYGRSKLVAEQHLLGLSNELAIKVIRCPTIMAAGRLGLLSILFEFIHEGRRVWLVGDGGNRYQFISAEDLAEACMLLASSSATGIFHVGSDEVPTVREMLGEVIRRAGTRARLTKLPRRPAIAALRLLSSAGLSPLGPYHYRMIASSFEFDTTRLRNSTGWRPTTGNTEMLWRAYRFYVEHVDELSKAQKGSPHRRLSGLGALRIVKWLS